MQIQPERIQEFMRLYEKEFNEKLTEEEAEVMIVECVQFYQDLLTLLPTDHPADQEF